MDFINKFFMIFPIIIPILGALIVRLLPINLKKQNMIDMIITIVTSLITFALVIFPPADSLNIIYFNDKLHMFFKLDGIGRIFAGMVALLWPFAFLYSFGYMEGERERENYSMFYTMTYAIVLGITFSGSLISLYFFYELLTLITIPLIIHPMTKEAKKAARFYLYISVFGSTLALMGIIVIIHYFGSVDFNYLFDNVANASKYEGHEVAMSVGYLLMFFGFGVKSAIFPFHLWLPKAGVAPTPTTALLHSVAVVKSGAFAIIRVIYSVIGSDIINGSKVQVVSSLFAAFTIIYCSSWAIKNLHLKRRYAYSTSSNISYIIFAATMSSKLGLLAAMLHFIIHSFAKITIFYSVGGFNKVVGIKNANQVAGLGKKMPITLTCFTVAGLSITGIPVFAGFFSKWQIAMAAIDNGNWFAYIGLGCVLFSAFLTAVYVLGIPVKAFFKKPLPEDIIYYEKAHELNYKFLVPIVTFASLSFLLGLFAKPLINMFEMILGIGG